MCKIEDGIEVKKAVTFAKFADTLGAFSTCEEKVVEVESLMERVKFASERMKQSKCFAELAGSQCLSEIEWKILLETKHPSGTLPKLGGVQKC